MSKQNLFFFLSLDPGDMINWWFFFPSFFFSCPFFCPTYFSCTTFRLCSPAVLKTKTLQMQIHIASKIYSTWKLKSALHSEWNVFMANLLRPGEMDERVRCRAREGAKIAKQCIIIGFWEKFFSAKCFRTQKRFYCMSRSRWVHEHLWASFTSTLDKYKYETH